MSEPIKLTQEELEKLGQIQQVMQNITFEYGNIELTRKALEDRVTRVDDALSQIRQQEQTFAKEIEDKYGRGSIDLQEGTFHPLPEQEAAPQQEGSTE